MFHVLFDISALTNLGDEIERVAQEALDEAGASLAAETHAHITEEAQQGLRSRREKYLDHLHLSQENNNTWLVVLDSPAMWIEEGMDEHEMIDDLLNDGPKKIGPGLYKVPKGKTHTAKDGSRYRVIPFFHGPGKGPTTSTSAQMTLQATIRRELKKAHNSLTGQKGIPYGKIEKDAKGNPYIGKLHDLSITSGPLKTSNRPGQGAGPIGRTMQGPTGIPLLQGIRIYQHLVSNKAGGQKVQRSIMTFRTVSSKMKGTGRWVHPGLEPKHFFEEAEIWAMKQWDDKIVPMVIELIKQKI